MSLDLRFEWKNGSKAIPSGWDAENEPAGGDALLLLERGEKWLQEQEIFERQCTGVRTRALGIIPSTAGLSCWKTGEALGVSQQAVLDWFRATQGLMGRVKKRRRRRVAVDEKVIHLPDGNVCLWTAIDLDTGEILNVEATGGRSILEAIAFLRPVKALCTGKAPRVFIDGGDWYPPALEHLGFRRYTVVAFGPRSAIEQFFGTVDRPHPPKLLRVLRCGKCSARPGVLGGPWGRRFKALTGGSVANGWLILCMRKRARD